MFEAANHGFPSTCLLVMLLHLFTVTSFLIFYAVADDSWLCKLMVEAQCQQMTELLMLYVFMLQLMVGIVDIHSNRSMFV